MWETPERPERGDDSALTTANAGRNTAAGGTCPTCGRALGPGKIDRCAACVEEEWAILRAEMGEEWS